MVQATLKQFRAAPALFTIAPRLDLRTGAVAAGVTDIDASTVSDDWVALMHDARMAWVAGGYFAPLSCAAPLESIKDASSASDLDQALRQAGYPMRGATLEVNEADIVASSGSPLEALERLRARGWGVMLRCAPDCPLPLGGKVRSIFTDVMVDAPADPTPFLGLDGNDDHALARRVAAAANAGLNVTANNLHTMAYAGLLVASGFDRGQGPGLRMKALV